MSADPAAVERRMVPLPTLAATALLARKLAEVARIGDVIGLAGALGAGKTTLARSFIAARGGAEEVPSPTFNLVQVYDLPGAPVWHFDLYRLARPADAYELGIEDAFAEAISLIEWPERLGALLPADRLDVCLAMLDGGDAREAHLAARLSWRPRLAGLLADG